ncbi:BAR domain protein, partial [Oesophagostomum dentatum]
MSLSGLRKQFNKANQYLSETMGAAEATKLDDQYNEMEKHIDTTYELISALVAGTNEYLQPNPATRAKMATMGAISKVRGTVKTSPYPQTEGMLADTMYKYGGALGDNSDLGKALLEAAEAYRHMADIKYQMEEN